MLFSFIPHPSSFIPYFILHLCFSDYGDAHIKFARRWRKAGLVVAALIAQVCVQAQLAARKIRGDGDVEAQNDVAFVNRKFVWREAEATQLRRRKTYGADTGARRSFKL